MNRRIAITGANGVGKTTLATALSERLQLPPVPEVARTLCRQLGFQNPSQIPDQEKFKVTVLESQIAKETKLPQFVADRSTIDCWVMWQRWQMCSAMTHDTESYYEKCRAQANFYSHVIYVPPLFPPAEDEFRWTEPDYIKQIDRGIRLAIYDWQINERTYTVTASDLTQRIHEVLAWLKH